MTTDETFYKSILDHFYDGVYFVDVNRRITYWNLGAERITGFRSAQVVGHVCADNLLMHVDNEGCLLCTSDCPLSASMRDRQVHEAQVYLRHSSGHRIPVQVRVAPIVGPDGQVVGAVETFSDNSSLLVAQQRADELALEATRDPLTGVNNRRGLQSTLESALADLDRSGIPSALVLFDLDHFKQVNDTLGHVAGDAVLKMVARTLQVNVRPTDAVGRWGGEEFLAVLHGVDHEHVAELAGRMCMLVEQSRLPLGPGKGFVGVTVSAGAVVLRPGEGLEGALERADRLLYASKQNGRNRLTCEEPQSAS